ncbi:unnamed protein product [Lathyrus oleraceus]
MITIMEEIGTYMMEKWATNTKRFQNLADADALPNIRRKVEKTSTYTNLWFVRMSNEHIFKVRHFENLADNFTVNLKEHLCSYRRWEITDLPCVHSFSDMRSSNHKVDDYIPEYYKKSRYMADYKHVIYPVNVSNMWVRTKYPDGQQPKYRKMPGRPKKNMNLEKGEIDGSNCKIRRTGFIVKCSRCKKPGYNKHTCKVTLASQPSQNKHLNNNYLTNYATRISTTIHSTSISTTNYSTTNYSIISYLTRNS